MPNSVGDFRWPTVEAQLDHWSYKDPNSGCWIWAGSTSNGYAMAVNWRYPGIVRAHRLAYTHFIGEIPKGLQLDHLCRVRCCVNPNHLEAVSQQENIKRGIRPYESHTNGRKTHCPQGHPYDDKNTAFNKRPDGRLSRRCLTCCRIRQQKLRELAKGLTL